MGRISKKFFLIAFGGLLFLVQTFPAAASTKPNLATFTSDRYHFSVAAVPAWVESSPLPTQQDRLKMRGQSVHYILSDWQTRLQENESSEYTRLVYAPVTESGVQDAAEIVIDFSPDYEELILHHVTLLREGQRLARLVPDQVRLIQQERDMNKHMYNGEVSALLVLNDVRVGDVIDYAYTIRGRNPVFGDKYFTAYPLGWKVPVDRIAIRLLAPEQRPLQARTYHIDLEPQIKLSNGQREYRWQLEHAPAMMSEDEQPKWYSRYPWLQISEYKDWSEVNNWSEALYRFKGDLSAELQSQIKQWRRDSHDEREAVRLALQFVQDRVRYFGVEMGQNSHRPSHPNEVFSRRYGDCKDKALLLVAILQELGFKAYPALVSMDRTRAVGEWLPSPGIFDHVIVMAQLGSANYWLDATSTYQRGKLDARGLPNFGKALVVGKHSRSLTDMTLPENYLPTINVEELFVAADYKSPVNFMITSTFSHDEAEWKRYYFDSKPLSEISDDYLNYYARIYPGIERSAELVIRDDEENNLFQVVEKYRIPDYWEREEGRLYMNFYGSAVRDYVYLPKTMNRSTPLAQTFPLRVSHTSMLQYPEDIDFDDIDEAMTVEDEAMKFMLRTSYANRYLKVQYQYDSKSDAVMPEAIASHLSKRRRVSDNLQYSAWIDDREQNALPAKSLAEKVLSRLTKTALP